MDSSKLNIFQLSNALEGIAPVKLQVVFGLGSGLFGVIYSCMFYAENKPFTKTVLRLANVLLLFIAYLFSLKLYMYRTLDVVLFLLATNGRALKSIITATDIARGRTYESKKISEEKKDSKTKTTDKKTAAWMPALKEFLPINLVMPRVTTKPVSFDKVFEEMVFRLLLLSNMHILYTLSFSSFSILAHGILYTTLSYTIRYVEYSLTKTTPPGVLTEDAYSIYVWLLHIVFITELYAN
ncbi:hypothetical protein NEMIN01_1935 [Nematocida minor]|uniref:uncharacterized protein n=1 Tax=Nematocida minor TaxID=1912983 RepID=UPI0022207F63|nr:uncharacterized protein NEMIN01_1935 [Nematocida minor]KAI5192306.1 hypothetical protein NEMIN01_1935 [Nematocida minor]